MTTNYKNRLTRVENMLDFMKIAVTKCKSLFKDECHYYIYINDCDEVEIVVRKPSFNYAPLTWKHSSSIFTGSIDELRDYIESLTPATNVVPIK